MASRDTKVNKQDAFITGIGLVGGPGETRGGLSTICSDCRGFADANLVYRESSPVPLPESVGLTVAQLKAVGPQFQYGIIASAAAAREADLFACQQITAATGVFAAVRPAERDAAVDKELFLLDPNSEGLQSRVNHVLSARLRPTLFLAQLPNLLPGNLSIVLGIKGPSRTFLGEEMAGVAACSSARDAVVNCRAPRVLVVAALNAAQESLLRWRYSAFRGALSEGPSLDHALGSIGVAIVVESGTSSEERKVRRLAKIVDAQSSMDRVSQKSSGTSCALERVAAMVSSRSAERVIIVTNAPSGVAGDFERGLWSSSQCSADTVYLKDVFGGTLEADAPAGIAVATRALESGVPLRESFLQTPTRDKRGFDRAFVITRSDSRGVSFVELERVVE
jgi:3-oxoacyl-[acyl-carrier-protein] synthase II